MGKIVSIANQKGRSWKDYNLNQYGGFTCKERQESFISGR